MSCLESESRLAILHMPASHAPSHRSPESEASILGFSVVVGAALALALSLAMTVARLA